MDLKLNKIKNDLRNTRHSILNARRYLALMPKSWKEKIVKLLSGEKSEYIGRYKFTNFVDIPGGKRIVLEESPYIYNLVTNAGRSLFLNRIANNNVNFINAVAIGTGTNNPALADTTLQTETSRKNASSTVYLSPSWKTVFSALFSSSEVNGTTEIGLLNSQSTGGSLATRNVHTAISVPDGSSIQFDYEVLLQSGEKSTGYTLTTGKTYTFEKPQTVPVLVVIENDTGNGYCKKTSTSEVEATACSYYYDSVNNKLYLHSSNGADPDTHEIIVYAGA